MKNILFLKADQAAGRLTALDALYTDSFNRRICKFQRYIDNDTIETKRVLTKLSEVAIDADYIVGINILGIVRLINNEYQLQNMPLPWRKKVKTIDMPVLSDNNTENIRIRFWGKVAAREIILPTRGTSFYIKRVLNGKSEYKRCKCIDGWSKVSSNCWKFSRSGAKRIVKREKEHLPQYIYLLVDAETGVETLV